MFDRLKRVLVESYIGAIALGYLLAEVTIYFVNVFTAPVSAWATGNLYRELLPGRAPNTDLPIRAALSAAAEFVLLLVVWYALLRWLYFSPAKQEMPDPERSA